MGLIDTLLNQLKRLFEPVIGPLTRLWNILKGFFTAIIDVVPKTISLVKLIYSEVLEWKSFIAEPKVAINFKGGVVNIQSVKDKIASLIDEFKAAWQSLVDLFTGGFKRVSTKPLQDAEEAAAELADLFEGFARVGLREFLEKVGPKIKKAGGKVFEVLAIVQAIAEELIHVIDDITSIVNVIKDVRETITQGEGLFLQQKNARKSLKLADGGSIKIRLGSLHPSA